MNWLEHFEAPPDARELPGLRRAVQERMRTEGMVESVVSNAGLLISELAHNAVDHAEESDLPVRVALGVSEDGVHLSVECAGNDDLPGLAQAMKSSGILPSPESERGRGLWLIANLSDQLEVDRGEHGGVRVRLLVREDA